MKQPRKLARKAWSLTALALAAALGITLAAYTHEGYKRGVIRAAKTEALFSSDVLRNNEGFSKSVVFTAQSTELTQTFHVYNYSLGGVTANSRPIEYTLTVQLLGTVSGSVKIGGEGISEQTLNTAPDCTVSYGRSMPAGALTDHAYTLTLPLSQAEGADNYSVFVTVTPTEDSQKSARAYDMYCRFIPTRSATVAPSSAGITGSFPDAAGVSEPQDCAAFNYRLSLLNFVGTKVLTWDGIYLSLDTFYTPPTDDITVTVDRNAHTITITTATEQTKDIDLVFYRTAAPEPQPEGWDTWDSEWSKVESKLSLNDPT